jgi:hypothetical protein
MKQITTNGKDWLFVEIPEGTTVELSTDGKVLAYQIIPMTAFNDPTWHIDLPDGSWELHATTDNMNGSDRHMMMETVDKLFYKDYVDPNKRHVTNAAAFGTFLEHHNLTNRYAILHKQ